MSAARVLVVGPLPPPVTGFSQVTAWFVQALEEAGVATQTVRTLSSAPVGTPALQRRLRRLGTIVSAWLRVFATLFLSRGRVSAMYLPISGGVGQWLELPFVLMARLAGVRLLIHHHSFAYLLRRSPLTALLLRCAGRSALQVTLGPAMADALRRQYGVQALAVLSNGAFVAAPSPLQAAPRDGALRLGYLGNVSRAKGALVFVEVCERLSAAGVQYQACMAGPFEDAEVEAEVRARGAALPHFECLGPVFGTHKQAFLDGLDVLLFPSAYVNEAEPVVILEALAHGTPVIATPRGCVADLLAYDAGFALVADAAQYAVLAAQRLARLAADLPTVRAQMRDAASAEFRRLHGEAQRSLDALVQWLAAPAPVET